MTTSHPGNDADVTGAVSPTRLAPVSDEAVADALERLYEFFVDQYAAIVAMPSSFDSAKQGMRLAAEPEELAHTVLSKLADKLETSSTTAELEDRLRKFCSPSYIYRVMENANIDLARHQQRIRPLGEVYGQVEDLQGSHESTDAERDGHEQNARTLLEVLLDRSMSHKPGATCLTPLHVRCWQAVVTGRGAQSQLAQELGVDRSRITQIKASAVSKVQLALYVAGILGPPETLRSAGGINACLDTYDGLSGRQALDVAQRARLAVAAPTVQTTPTHGQRADHRAAASRYLRRKDKKALSERFAADDDARAQFYADFADTLHAAEAAQAASVCNPYPNCTLDCDFHNPVHDRIVWEAWWI
jgi:hypothetical protein